MKSLALHVNVKPFQRHKYAQNVFIMKVNLARLIFSCVFVFFNVGITYRIDSAGEKCSQFELGEPVGH